MFVPAIHFGQPAVNLILDVHDVQPHFLLCDFKFALELLQQGLAAATTGWCLKTMVIGHKLQPQQEGFHRVGLRERTFILSVLQELLSHQ